MKVSSFTVDHDRLLRGVYVSRIDSVGTEKVTTFDVRMKLPNADNYLPVPAIHTIEHIMAVYLRTVVSADFSDKVLYVGPMGCRTGMYLLLKGEHTSKEIVSVLVDLFKYIKDFDGEVPATTSIECGNYKEHDLEGAKKEAREYLEVLENIKEENLNYPK